MRNMFNKEKFLVLQSKSEHLESDLIYFLYDYGMLSCCSMLTMLLYAVVHHVVCHPSRQQNKSLHFHIRSQEFFVLEKKTRRTQQEILILSVSSVSDVSNGSNWITPPVFIVIIQ